MSKTTWDGFRDKRFSGDRLAITSIFFIMGLVFIMCVMVVMVVTFIVWM